MISQGKERVEARVEILELQVKQVIENFQGLSMEVKRLGCKMGNFFEEHRNCSFVDNGDGHDE